MSTKMTGKDMDKPTMDMITPKKAANSCFRDIGINPMSRGAFKHVFFGWFLEVAPLRLVQKNMLVQGEEFDK